MKIRIYAYSDKYHEWVGNMPLFYVGINKTIGELNELADDMLLARFTRLTK